jgi:hypothetical protein
MHRTLLAVFIATGLMVVASTMAAGAAPAGGGCVEPVPQRNYGPDRVVYSMVMDLSGCDWWDGGEVVLEATLSRLDGQGETVANRFTTCGVRLDRPQSGPSSGESEAGGSDEVVRTPESMSGDDGGTARTWSGLCDVFADLDHPGIEAALYRGEITYPWAGTQRSVSFAALCGPAADCVDLPADPSPALSAGSDLYDQLIAGVGDDD